MSFLARVYVWSIILEPMMFFVISHRTFSGVGGNLSRVLQLLVILGLIFRSLSLSPPFKVVYDWTSRVKAKLYRNYKIFFMLSLLSGFIGYFSGAFELPSLYEYNTGDTFLYRFIDSGTIRPIFEYVIFLYYFLYFTYLAQYFISNGEALDYFFRSFKFIFVFSAIIGVIDYVLAFGHITFLPRHFYEGFGNLSFGLRFHGLAGEPRDAFVFMFYGVVIFYLEAFYRKAKVSKFAVSFYSFLALLTQSASGVMGVLFFVVMYSISSIKRINIKDIIKGFFLISVILIILYIAVISSSRIMKYYSLLGGLFVSLETGGKIPELLLGQMSNIYPIYDLFTKVREGDLSTLLIGSGLGSASAVNNQYSFVYNSASIFSSIQNPHSQFVRTLFESGLLGTLWFIKTFYAPVIHLTANLGDKDKKVFKISILLMIGLFMGHRSSTCYLYLGVFIATFRIIAAQQGALVAKVNIESLYNQGSLAQ